MDWMEFFASIFRSVLSWPVAVLVLGYLFRDQLRERLGSIQEVRHKDKSVLFREKEKTLLFTRGVEELSEHMTDEPPTEQVDPAEEAAADEVEEIRRTDSWQERNDRNRAEAWAAIAALAERGRAQSLASTLADYPSAAILAAWDELEQAIILATRVNDPRWLTSNMASRMLAQTHALSSTDARTIDELHKLRNDVAHKGVSPTAAAAMEYAANVDRLLNKLGSFHRSSS